MSGFKDMVAADRARVFIDFDVFGESARVEGQQIIIVLDSDELKERQGGQDLAVAESSVLFYARCEDLPRRRPAGQSLSFNGRECIVDRWDEDMGVATVALHDTLPG